MSGRIPEAVLSERLRNAIGKRRVKTAVFLTYQFDPAFFEAEVMPLLFNQAFTHSERLRMLQLEEALLENGTEAAVYYDRSALIAESDPARLNYTRIGLSRRTGVFHPKVIMLLLENQEENGKTGEVDIWDSLLVMVSSANLTRAGWWENVEAAHIEEIQDRDKCSFRSDLLNLIRLVKRECRVEEEHRALETIRSFIHRLSYNVTTRWEGIWRTCLYTGREDVPGFLSEFIPSDEFHLEIISPFFDAEESAGTLERLLRETQPISTRIFLPEDRDGSARCSQGYFKAVSELKRVEWGRLPKELLRFSSSGKENQPGRFVHAKVYRFWNREREIFLVGSVNLTRPAHSTSRSGNLEAAFMVEPRHGTDAPSLHWWLESLPQEYSPAFAEDNPEDLPPQPMVPPCTMRYNWADGELAYFWEEGGSTMPQRAAISSNNALLFEIAPIHAGEWISLPEPSAKKIRDILKSTSFVDVATEGKEPARILVQEEGMAHRPSLLFSLTAEEILEYWSLLSPEQREAFLLAHVPALAAGGEWSSETLPLPQIETMFDRFAGIFHAFGRLESHIRESVKAGRTREAEYRLFGKRYDSLPSLIEKVSTVEHPDRVNQYVSLLCSRQLLERVAEENPEFAKEHQEDFRQVLDQLKVVDQIRNGFSFETPEYREKFLEWFDRMFFRKMTCAPAEEPE